jgi:hypothetical protein
MCGAAEMVARRRSVCAALSGEVQSRSASLANPLEAELGQEVLRPSKETVGWQDPCEPLASLQSLAAERSNVSVEGAIVQVVSALMEGVLEHRDVHVHTALVCLHSPLLDVRVKKRVSELGLRQHRRERRAGRSCNEVDSGTPRQHWVGYKVAHGADGGANAAGLVVLITLLGVAGAVLAISSGSLALQILGGAVASVCMKSVESLLPQDAVPAQPFVDLGERLGPKRVDPPLSVLADVDQPRLPQHPQVPRHPRASNRQQRCQLTRGCRAAGQGLEHRPPALVRECP